MKISEKAGLESRRLQADEKIAGADTLRSVHLCLGLRKLHFISSKVYLYVLLPLFHIRLIMQLYYSKQGSRNGPTKGYSKSLSAKQPLNSQVQLDFSQLI